MIRLGVEQRALELLEGEPELKHISDQVKLESAKKEIEIEEEEEEKQEDIEVVDNKNIISLIDVYVKVGQ